MPTKEIHKKGIQNIKDAHFVRKHLIPLTFEKAKWNLVVYQAYQSIELLIKGMIRLTGNEPLSQDKQGKRIDRHRIDLQVDHLSDILTSRKSTGMVPTAVIPTIDYSENDYYYLFLTDNLMYFGECVGGSHSDFDSGLPIPGLQADKLLDMRLEIDNKKIIVFAGEEQVGLYHHVFLTNLPQKEAYEFQWELGHLPDNKQVENLKKIGGKLRDTREDAFYSERDFSEAEAKSAMEAMNEINELAAYFLAESKASEKANKKRYVNNI